MATGSSNDVVGPVDLTIRSCPVSMVREGVHIERELSSNPPRRKLALPGTGAGFFVSGGFRPVDLGE